MGPQETVTFYSNPPNNIIGTVLFLSYIGFALYFTSTIVLLLRRQAQSQDKPTAQHGSKTLAFLAFLSFSALSWHMSSFLLHSFLQWNLAQDFFYSNQNASLGGKIWRWMLDSTLFEDFGKELVSNGPSTLWTQISLLGTWFWNVYIAQEARTRKLGFGTIAPYLALGQILPISFSACLFLLHVQLLPKDEEVKDTKKNDGARKGNSKKKSDVKVKGDSKAKLPVKNDAITLTVPTIVFNILLLVLPSFKQSGYFIPLVLLTRIFLLLPHRYRMGRSGDDLISSAMLAAGFVAANVGIQKKAYTFNQLARGLRDGGDAVKALSWDAILGLVVAALV